jgi:hypothetical protein
MKISKALKKKMEGFRSEFTTIHQTPIANTANPNSPGKSELKH